MALDNLGDKKKEEDQDWLDEQKKEEVEELATELGLEDKDDLEELDGRLDTISQIAISADKRITQLEERMDRIENLSNLMIMFGSDLMEVRRELDLVDEENKYIEEDENDDAWIT